MNALVEQLLRLSRQLGRPEAQLAILGEGNTSVRVREKTFLVKASGGSLSTLTESDVVECRFEPLLELLDRNGVPSDEDVTRALMGSRVSASGKRPSTEAFFHAYLLTLPDISWVAHTHPVAVNGILCSSHAVDFATRRMFPDEIVCCGPLSVLVPYIDPGIELARGIRAAVECYRNGFTSVPRIVLLTNHGIISMGKSDTAVMASTLMSVKAATVFTAAASMGGPIFLSDEDLSRIENRGDEHYRRQRLRL